MASQRGPERQIWVTKPNQDEEDSFYERIGADSETNELLRKYYGFSGFFIWDGESNELKRIHPEDRGFKSDLLARLLLPETLKELKNQVDSNRATFELQRYEIDRPEGVIWREGEGKESRYFIGGLEIEDQNYTDLMPADTD
jgi:hypothetical protein